MATIAVFLYVAASCWLIFQLVTPFLTVLASQLFGRDLRPAAGPQAGAADFGCIITAYKNAAIARPLVESLLKQTYSKFTIYLVADECPSDFDLGVDDPKVVVLRPDPSLRLKAKSIIYAMDRYQRPHTHTAVFDADNLAHPEFLREINRYIDAGYRSIQGQRTAKKLDSTYAAADSLGELYKNYIERYAPFLIGGSAVISGSGMVTETALYRAYLDSPEIAEGQHLGKKMLQEDKILQNFLLRRNERIAYAQHAICYDEKVQSGDAVQTQRSRWLFSYFQNIPNSLGILRRGLLGLRWNQTLFGVITLALPMFIQLAVAGALMVLGLLIDWRWSAALLAACAIFGVNLLWTMRLSNASPAVWRAIAIMPRFVIRQAMGLLKMGNPQKNFKHTEHTQYVSVEEVMNDK